MNIRTLLIQVRPDRVTRDHEFDLVMKQTGLHQNAVRRLNVFEENAAHDVLKDVDALIVGGSGDYLISQGDIPEQVEAIGRVAQHAREMGVPTLGICFGAQVLTHAFGGKVDLDEENAETGTFEIQKTPEANRCPLFAGLPERFRAQLGHKDHLMELPNDAVHLASSERSRHQAYTFSEEPVYALTFHPELDEEAIRWRLDYYAQNYGLEPKVLTELKSRIQSTPEASTVLKTFFTRVVQEGERYK